jgi:RNA polymerase sigma-70 factor (sigma-E family)
VVEPEAEPASLADYVRARLPALLRHAAVITGDRALAEDVVQEVLARAHAKWRHISRTEHPEAYLKKMIVNEYLSWRRRWSRVQPVESVPDMLPDAPDHASRHAEREALRAEMARLPRHQRVVLVLRYYEDLSDAQIADVLGCSPGTVRGHASRALAKLRVNAQSALNPPPAGSEPWVVAGWGEAVGGEVTQ